MVEMPIWLAQILAFLAVPGLVYLIEGIPLLYKELKARWRSYN